VTARGSGGSAPPQTESQQRQVIRVDLLESISESFIALDREWRFTYINKRIEDSLGIPKEQILGRNIWQVFPDARETEFYPQYCRVMNERVPVTFEIFYAPGNVWLEVHAHPTEEGLSAYVFDITKRKQAEEEARRGEQRFRVLIEKSADAIALSSAEGKIFYASPSTVRVLGYTPEELLNVTGIDLLHPDDVASTQLLGLQLREPGAHVTSQKRVRHRDGSWRWIESTDTNLLHDPNVRGIVSNYRDITESKAVQEKLRRSEERFRALIENSAEGFALLDRDGRIVYLGNSILGYGAGEKLDERVVDLIHPEDRDEAIRVMMGIFEQPDAVAVSEYRARHKDGSWLWMESTAKNLLHLQTVQAIVVTYRDITYRKKAETGRREQEQRLRVALEAGRMGAWDWELQSGAGDWSETLTALQAGPHAVVQGQDSGARLRIHPDDRAEVETAVRKAIDNRSRFDCEFRTLSTDGSVHWLSSSGQVLYDDRGTPLRMVGVTMDVTERKQGQDALAKLAAIVESSEDAIISKDLHGTIQTWNAAAERVYGYSAEDVKGKSMALLLPADRPQEEAEILSRIERGERVDHFETVRIRKGGNPIEVSLTISPIHDARGQIIGASHVARNITEQKKLEQQMRHAQKLESLGVLAGGVAHDFNNLLVGIIGNASLIQDALPAGDPNRELLENVVVAGQRASDLTRQLLAYAGKGQFQKSSMDLSTSVREMSGLVQASFSKKVEMRLELDNRLPAIEADKGQVQQIIMNLVMNAAEAIGENKAGRVIVSTKVQQIDEREARQTFASWELRAGRYVLLEVRDTGLGMDEATQARIFDPFFTTKFTGRGLGLSAVLGIVKAHKGALSVHSRPGEGSTFQVLFPSIDTAFAPAATARVRRELQGTGTILVIDDEPFVRNMAKFALERYGYTVTTAMDGVSGLDLFRERPDEISLVLLDLTMPVMSGEETLAELIAIRPDVCVLLSSGFSEMEALRRFAGRSLAGFIQKPYTAAQLAERVKAILEPSRPT
jgi:two-component system cell cycle sensor histidine kinase/response regulator CckA